MSDHLETLRQYNAWRRGDPTLLMIAPEKIGVAIDATIAEVERLLAQLGGKDDISQSLIDENERLRAAIRQTLDENGHLADGDVCTLIVLKRALPEWE
jgi:hypothetical protein